MSGFKDMVAADNHSVFLNLDEFGERRTVIYDGVEYTDIPVVMPGRKQRSRHQLQKDHMQGVYQGVNILRCAISDLGGNQPEKGRRIQINDQEGGGGFFHDYYVASSVCEMGVLRVELEAMDE